MASNNTTRKPDDRNREDLVLGAAVIAMGLLTGLFYDSTSP